MIVFVILYYTRAAGHSVSVHATEEGVERALASFRNIFSDRDYEWRDGKRGETRYLTSHDDGPRATVERQAIES